MEREREGTEEEQGWQEKREGVGREGEGREKWEGE